MSCDIYCSPDESTVSGSRLEKIPIATDHFTGPGRTAESIEIAGLDIITD